MDEASDIRRPLVQTSILLSVPKQSIQFLLLFLLSLQLLYMTNIGYRQGSQF